MANQTTERERAEPTDAEAGSTARLDEERARRAANLFDLRRLIGGLFLIYGVILTVLGVGASDAEIEKAAGINLNLWVGLSLLVVGALFLAWAFARPLSDELERTTSEPRTTHGRRRSDRPERRAAAQSDEPAGRARPRAHRRDERSRRQQRQHRAAEAAPDHARAGGAGALERARPSPRPRATLAS